MSATRCREHIRRPSMPDVFLIVLTFHMSNGIISYPRLGRHIGPDDERRTTTYSLYNTPVDGGDVCLLKAVMLVSCHDFCSISQMSSMERGGGVSISPVTGLAWTSNSSTCPKDFNLVGNKQPSGWIWCWCSKQDHFNLKVTKCTVLSVVIVILKDNHHWGWGRRQLHTQLCNEVRLLPLL